MKCAGEAFDAACAATPVEGSTNANRVKAKSETMKSIFLRQAVAAQAEFPASLRAQKALSCATTGEINPLARIDVLCGLTQGSHETRCVRRNCCGS